MIVNLKNYMADNFTTGEGGTEQREEDVGGWIAWASLAAEWGVIAFAPTEATALAALKLKLSALTSIASTAYAHAGTAHTVKSHAEGKDLVDKILQSLGQSDKKDDYS